MKRDRVRLAALCALICFCGLPQAARADVSVPPESGPASAGSTTRHDLTPGCVAARKYIDLGAAHRVAEIGGLFADKVDYVGPDGVARSDGGKVAKVYASMSKSDWALHSKVTLLRLVPLHRNECFMEFTSGPPEGPMLYGVDHFIVGSDGKVIWFRPFFQQAFSFK
jgi:hypothetical protein